MSEINGALIVFGSGPGVGRNVAAVFAEHSISTVVLISRNATRLADDAQFVRSANRATRVEHVVADLGDAERVPQLCKEVERLLGDTPLLCVLFNAARLGKSELLQFTPEEFRNDVQISVLSLYAVAQWAFPRLLKAPKSQAYTPSFLVTSGMLAKDPAPAMFSLAACKAAQYNLTHSLHKKYEAEGVHCTAIIIGGKVADVSKVTNARNIAEQHWMLFAQGQGQGSHELVLMDPAYAEHVKARGTRTQ